MKKIIELINNAINQTLFLVGINPAAVESDSYYVNDSERTNKVFRDKMRLCPFCRFYKNERVAVIFYLYDDGQAVVVVFDGNGKRIFEKEFDFFLTAAQTKELAKWMISLENKKVVFRPLTEYSLYASAYDAQVERQKANAFDKLVDAYFSETEDFPDKKPGTNRAYYRVQRKKAIRRKASIVRDVYGSVPYTNDPQDHDGFCKYAGQFSKGKIHDSRCKVRGRNYLTPNDRRRMERDAAAYEDYLDGEWLFPINI